jgi:hypothetical protein
MASTAATHRRRWSQAEKDVCAAGVKKFGAFNHRRIAQLVGTRSKAQVRTYLYAAGYRKLGAGYTTVAAAAREAADLAGSEAPVTAPAATEPATAHEAAPTKKRRVKQQTIGPGAPTATSGTEPPTRATHVPFWSAAELAADGWTPPQRKAFERAFARQLALRFDATEITSVDVVHGHGTVARRLLLRGEVFVDPCAAFIPEAPPASDDRAVRYEDAHFRLRSDTRAAPSYYLNEARSCEPNVEWRVIDLGRPALGFVVLRDIRKGEELLLFYEAPD